MPTRQWMREFEINMYLLYERKMKGALKKGTFIKLILYFNYCKNNNYNCQLLKLFSQRLESKITKCKVTACFWFDNLGIVLLLQTLKIWYILFVFLLMNQALTISYLANHFILWVSMSLRKDLRAKMFDL